MKFVHPILFWDVTSCWVGWFWFLSGSRVCCPSHISTAWSKNNWKVGGTEFFSQWDATALGRFILKSIASGSSHRRIWSNDSCCDWQCGHVGFCQCCPPALALRAGVASWL